MVNTHNQWRDLLAHHWLDIAVLAKLMYWTNFFKRYALLVFSCPSCVKATIVIFSIQHSVNIIKSYENRNIWKFRSFTLEENPPFIFQHNDFVAFSCLSLQALLLFWSGWYNLLSMYRLYLIKYAFFLCRLASFMTGTCSFLLYLFRVLLLYRKVCSF